MEWLNRIALVVTPKRRFFDWVNGLPEAGPPLKTEEAASHRMLYLAATGDAMPPLNELIDTYWEEIFDEALGEWILDESLWPVNRTAHVFRDWFHVESIDGVRHGPWRAGYHSRACADAMRVLRCRSRQRCDRCLHVHRPPRTPHVGAGGPRHPGRGRAGWSFRSPAHRPSVLQ